MNNQEQETTTSVEAAEAGDLKVFRNFTGWQDKLVYYLAGSISLLHIWFNAMAIIPTVYRNALHMSTMLVLVFLFYPAMKRSPEKRFTPIDVLLSVLAVGGGIYVINFFFVIHLEQMSVPVLRDTIAGAIIFFVLLEGARRASGWLIPAIAVFFSLYTVWFGSMIPGAFFYRGTSIERYLFRTAFTDESIFGIVANISSTYVFLFVLFGAFLIKSGAGDFIVDLARSAAGRVRGGPAQVAVVASGLLGSVSGSAIANTVTSGSLTIPLMKKVGYRPHVAGAVEAAASTGGQLMPPIMGAGAFIMAQWTGLPYIYIVGIALIPALMYFISVGFFVYIEARKEGIGYVDPKELAPIKEVLKKGGHFFIPLILLITVLIIGYTPIYAGFVGIISVILTSWLRKDTRMYFKDIMDALYLGARNVCATAAILLTAGIVVGVAGMTGIGITFSGLIIELSQGILLLAIILVAFASLILGMGLPVTAAYIMLAILAAPALESLGVSLIAAHMIVFWYSQDANVTPPICLAAYAASGVAGSHPMKTGFTSWKLAKGLYIIPLLFAYTPLLFVDGPVWETVVTALVATLGLFSFSVTLEGFFLVATKHFERALWALAALSLLWPVVSIQAIGLLLFSALAFYQYKANQAANTVPVEA